MSSLDSILRPRPKTQSSASYSPAASVRQIESNLTARNYAQHKTLDLLGLEEEFASRISWLADLKRLVPDADKRSLAAVRAELQHPSRQAELISTARIEFAKRNKWLSLYPDEGPLRRELYNKHTDLFRNGATSNERLAIAANRAGKTLAAAYETTCHATGIYPHWWEGYRFTEPLPCAWIVNKGAKDCRDINEQELLGPSGNLALRGTGMIPAHRILKCTPKSGTPNAVEFIDILHVSGGTSRLQSKSFDQGREAFQGTATPWIWLDEECPDDVYGECLMRTMTCNGLILMTYTPIQGLTTLTAEFLHAAGIEIEGQPIVPLKEKTA